jgi:EAL domain-containing protein (putative c-di-GMP-specific phosphodiesterase class I)/CheY-like chemotaxis protein
MADLRLLVIDDEVEFATFVGRVAADCGFVTAIANDPEEFRSRLATITPDVIVMDLQMPRVDGVELLRELAQGKVAAKIILASGVDSRVLDTAKQLGLDAGLDIMATVLKPIRAADLRRIFESARGQSAPITPADIERAIADGEMALHYQPRLDARSGTITSAEALIRWWHPSKGQLFPGQFLSVAENSAVIDQLTAWVLEAAIAQTGAWRKQGMSLAISANVSARNLGDLGLPDRIFDLCKTHGLPPDQLTIELTETATMKDAGKIMDILTRMRLKGFGLAIDDFGTGYSSLVQLRRLPFTELKIDKSFVIDMLTSRDSALIVKTIIDMAHNLGLVPVAEGVESQVAAEQLIADGCYLLQGYWISRPLPTDKFEAVFKSFTLPAGLQRKDPKSGPKVA